jgi:hypothetical protein
MAALSPAKREWLAILARARSLLLSEGFDIEHDRRRGISLGGAVLYAESMLVYGDQISDDDRDLREFWQVCPLTLEDALARIETSKHAFLETRPGQRRATKY